jgi:CxxC motif-containing protein (DUF1111 family)
MLTQKYHHGQFTKLRNALISHVGEVNAVTNNFHTLDVDSQNAVIEFLKSLQVVNPDLAQR